MASTGALNLLRDDVETASTVGDTKAVELHMKELCAVLKVTSRDNATSIDVTIQHSLDGVNWFTLASFTQLTGTASATETEFINITSKCLPRVRAVTTLAGSTQAATVTVDLCYEHRR